MIARAAFTLGLVLASAACAKTPQSDAEAPGPDITVKESSFPRAMSRVDRTNIDVTHGAVDALAGGALAVRDPEVRAVATDSNGDEASLRFTYRGPTKASAPLASGELRRQVGLKLRAQNGCNVVYVMWRIAPKEELVVSVKENAGMSVHAECGAKGYRYPAPRESAAIPTVDVGASHTLAARLVGDELTVQVDGVIAWHGALGGSVASLRGPAGFRTDNAELDLELSARAARTSHHVVAKADDD